MYKVYELTTVMAELEGQKDKEVDKRANDDLTGIVGKIEEEMNR